MPTNKPLENIKSRIIVSGNVVEITTYERGYFKNYHDAKKVGRSSKNATNEDKSFNREKVLQRARARVRRLACANPQLNKFFTLTFADNITDLKYANNQFCNFIKRLNRYLAKMKKDKMQYIAVVEFQKRGAIHYHLLCNLPFISAKKLQEIWQNGFVKINKIDDVDNVGAYVTKYMSKDNEDERLVGNRCYFTSQGLQEPTTIEENGVENTIAHLLLAGDIELQKEPYKKTFENEQLGNIEYTQLTLVKPLNTDLINSQIKSCKYPLPSIKSLSETQPEISILRSNLGLSI